MQGNRAQAQTLHLKSALTWFYSAAYKDSHGMINILEIKLKLHELY